MKTLDRPESLLRRISTPLTHLLFIIIIFVLPELVMAIALPHRRGPGLYPGFYVKTLIYIAAFYLNYFIIIDRTIGRAGRHRALRFALWNIAIMVSGLLLSYLISRLCFPPRHPAPDTWTHVLKSATFLLRDAVMIILTIGLSVALRLSAKWQDIDRERQEAVAAQRSTELANLKSQLNPHFLFNTLNTIYALVDISPEDAKKAVHRLSGLLRYMLYDDVTTVQLHQEADFIENYVSLMKLRIDSRPIEVNIDLGESAHAEVPPLLFIPLVENAFKYGITASDSEPIVITMKAESSRVVCSTRNSFAQSSDGNSAPASSGIGHANLRRRLQLIYGNKATLTTSDTGGVYTAVLTIPLES